MLGVIEFLLVLVCFVFLGAIGMFIGGLIAKKKMLWIWGIILSVVCFIAFAGGGLIHKSVDENMYDDYPIAYDQAVSPESPSYFQDSTGVVPYELQEKLHKTFGEPLTGIYYNTSNQEYPMPLFIDPKIRNLGVGVDSLKISQGENQYLTLVLTFSSNSDSKRKFMLVGHGSGEAVRLEHVLTLRAAKGAKTNVSVVLPEDEDMSVWRYCTLTLFE